MEICGELGRDGVIWIIVIVKRKYAMLNQMKKTMKSDYVDALSFPKGFMLVGIITGKGTLPLIKTQSNFKINSIAVRRWDKVWIDHDAATSHTSKKTQEYLQEASRKFGINFIKNSEIPIKALLMLQFLTFSVSDIWNKNFSQE